MRKTTWKVRSIAECQDCGWHYENYKNAQALGAKMVRVETTLISLYNYPEGYFIRSSNKSQTEEE